MPNLGDVRLLSDSAQSLDFAEADGPDIALGVEAAVARFNSAASHPYLLFDKARVPEIRRLADANPKLQAQLAKLLSQGAPAQPPQEPRAGLKRRARRLISTAFISLTAERSVAQPALAATRRALAELRRRRELEGTAGHSLVSRLLRNRRRRRPRL